MSHASRGESEVSLTPPEGWHCSHLYYRFDRRGWPAMSPAEIRAGREQFARSARSAIAGRPGPPANVGRRRATRPISD